MARLSASFALFLAFIGSTASAAPPCECRGEWLVSETEHFAVWSRLSRERTIATAEICERLRTELCTVWCDPAHAPQWRSKCVVTLHADAAAYAAAIGSPGDRSRGCTTLEVGAKGVTFRRADLRCDSAGWEKSALPHELTHVVLADRLGGRPLPLWADEALAVFAEPEATRQKRDDALVAAVRHRAVYSAGALLCLCDPPPAAMREGFYGQSALIAALLIERGTPAEFLAFLEDAERSGYDAALRRSYGLDGVAGLERLWEAKKRAAAPGFLVEATGRAALAARASREALAVAQKTSG